jgi:hypothetical protein
MTDVQMTPGDRRELRSLTKKQFQILRAEVKRRASEMRAEVETDLLHRYRQQDEDLQAAQTELAELTEQYLRDARDVARRLQTAHPELTVQLGRSYHSDGVQLSAKDESRGQLHQAALAAIPTKIADAETQLDQQEIDLLRELTVGALTTDEARSFLNRIPTVGALVPTARLPELESS